MRYMGGKYRTAKETARICNLALAHSPPGTAYVEPFCGALGVAQYVNPTGPKILGDINTYLIAMWKAVQAGWIPPSEVSEDLYREVKANKDRFPPELVAFIGFGCSFSGKFFGGYIKSHESNKDPIGASAKRVRERSSVCRSASFHLGDYKAISTPPGSVIYCDPPYQETTGYSDGSKSVPFDSRAFWQWCVGMSEIGNTVIVSEYSETPPVPCVQLWAVEGKQWLGEHKHTVSERVFLVKHPEDRF